MIDHIIYDIDEIPLERVRSAIRRHDITCEAPRKIHGYHHWSQGLGTLYVFFDGMLSQNDIRKFLAYVYQKPKYQPKYDIDYGFKAYPIFINSKQHLWNLTTSIRVVIDTDVWNELLEDPAFIKFLEKHVG